MSDAHAWGLPKPSWTQRRRVLWFTLISLNAWISYVIWRGADTALNLQSMMILVPAMIALVGSYVFGAAWDDKNYMKAVTEYSAKQQPQQECPPHAE